MYRTFETSRLHLRASAFAGDSSVRFSENLGLWPSAAQAFPRCAENTGRIRAGKSCREPRVCPPSVSCVFVMNGSNPMRVNPRPQPPLFRRGICAPRVRPHSMTCDFAMNGFDSVRCNPRLQPPFLEREWRREICACAIGTNRLHFRFFCVWKAIRLTLSILRRCGGGSSLRPERPSAIAYWRSAPRPW